MSDPPYMKTESLYVGLGFAVIAPAIAIPFLAMKLLLMPVSGSESGILLTQVKDWTWLCMCLGAMAYILGFLPAFVTGLLAGFFRDALSQWRNCLLVGALAVTIIYIAARSVFHAVTPLNVFEAAFLSLIPETLTARLLGTKTDASRSEECSDVSDPSSTGLPRSLGQMLAGLKTNKRHRLCLQYLVLIICLTWAWACGRPRVSLMLRLGSWPSNGSIHAFWWSGVGMDSSFIWKIHFETEEDLDRWISSLRGFESNDDGGLKNTGLISDTWPSWWPNEAERETLEGLQKHRGGVREYVFIDRETLTVYAQWYDV